MAPNCVNSDRSVSALAGRLGDAEVDHLGRRPAVDERDQHVRRLDVAVDDPLLVGVLDRPADRDEQLQPLAGRELGFVAVLGDRDAVDQLHHEEGPAGAGGPGVEDFGDVGMVHQGQRLALGLEPGDDLAGVHAGLDDLERDLAADGRLLLGHVDDAHAAFADLLEQLVRSDPRTGAFGERAGDRVVARRRAWAERLRVSRRSGRSTVPGLQGGQGRAFAARHGPRGHQPWGGVLEEAPRTVVDHQEGLDLAAELGVVPARSVQHGRALGGRAGLDGSHEDLVDRRIPVCHVSTPVKRGRFHHTKREAGALCTREMEKYFQGSPIR